MCVPFYSRQVPVQSEVRDILCEQPHSRTEEQLHTALVGLQSAVPAFAEFPVGMQKALVKVAWYE